MHNLTEKVTKKGRVWRMCRGKRNKSEVKENEMPSERVKHREGCEKTRSGVIDVLWKEGKVLFDAGT